MISSKYEATTVKEKYLPPPCQEITDVKYKLQTFEYFNSTTLGIAIFYPSLMKQISQTQYVDAHTLIGNIGGYIGLFLGIIGKISFMEIIDINLIPQIKIDVDSILFFRICPNTNSHHNFYGLRLFKEKIVPWSHSKSRQKFC